MAKTKIVHHIFKSKTSLETLTFKYFEKGHTFMSTDTFHHQAEKESAQRSILMILATLWSLWILLEKCLSWKPDISLTSEIRKAVETMQIIQNLQRFQKFDFIKEKWICFREHHLGNLKINFVDSYKRSSGINVQRKFHVKFKVLQEDSMHRKKPTYPKNLQIWCWKIVKCFGNHYQKNENSTDLSVN